MVVDTSALVALFLREPATTSSRISSTMRSGPTCRWSPGWNSRPCSAAGDWPRIPRVAEFVDALHLDPVPVTYEQTTLAVEALLTFGKSRHPAGLNLGDCFAYALAKSLGAPLLFKGEDFAKTDITPAWRPGRVQAEPQQP